MRCAHCSIALPPDARFCVGCGQPAPGGPGPSATPDTRWIVVLVLAVAALWVVVVVGIIAAIAIPNLLNAIDRGKQKRTMADLRSMGAAIEAYSTEHGAYPVAPDLETLCAQLQPACAGGLPRDGWGHPLRASSDGTSYELISPGKDGVFQGCREKRIERFDDDVCFADGEFTQAPG
jgi:type II secretory pathway pseudopilin PulG